MKRIVKNPTHRAGLKNPNSKSKTEIPKQVRDDKKTRTKPSCHAELVSASGWLFSAFSRRIFHPRPCLPAGRHRKGFSDAILINCSLLFVIIRPIRFRLKIIKEPIANPLSHKPCERLNGRGLIRFADENIVGGAIHPAVGKILLHPEDLSGLLP